MNLAENAEFLSLRGTCIYVIGMFCNTKDGKREVRKHNWIASETRGMSTVCLPKFPDMLFNVADYKYKATLYSSDELNRAYASLPALTTEEKEVHVMVANLINSVEEMKALHALKQRIDKRMTQ